MQQLIQKPNTLRIAHQSELLELKRELAVVQARLKQLNAALVPGQPMSNIQRKLTIPTDHGMAFVPIAAIIYCKATGNYTQIFTRDNKYLISKTLKSVAKMINHTDFIRCHQSYLVNSKKVISFSSKKGVSIELSNSISIPVSRRKKLQVIEAISN